MSGRSSVTTSSSTGPPRNAISSCIRGPSRSSRWTRRIGSCSSVSTDTLSGVGCSSRRPACSTLRMSRRGSRPSENWRRRRASRPGRWDVLVDVYTSPGGLSEAIRIYLARGLSALPAGRPYTGEAEEAHLPRAWVPLDDARDLVLSGAVGSPTAVTGILAAWTSRAGGLVLAASGGCGLGGPGPARRDRTRAPASPDRSLIRAPCSAPESQIGSPRWGGLLGWGAGTPRRGGQD